MKIKNLLQDVLGGVFGVVGMVISLVRGGKGAITTGAAPPLGKSSGREEPTKSKGGAKGKKTEQLAAKKKKVKKPVTARKATPAPAKQAKQVGDTAPAKRPKKAVAAKGVKA
jgi:predicted lipid-binding transport protein (Tim44 family)